MSEKVAFGEEFNNAFLSFLLCLHLFFFLIAENGTNLT